MKKYLMVLAPFFFLISLFFFMQAYSLFESNRVNTTDLNIANWRVKVNEDVISGSSTSFTVDNVTWSSSTNVLAGKAAPGLSGYFDIEIDPNHSDTSIRYDVTFDFSNLDLEQFSINRIVEINNKPIVRTDEYTYSNIMTLGEINSNQTNTIRVYIDWVNNENNNEKDSNLGKVHNNVINIPVVVTVTQHFSGETLPQYVGD